MSSFEYLQEMLIYASLGALGVGLVLGFVIGHHSGYGQAQKSKGG